MTSSCSISIALGLALALSAAAITSASAARVSNNPGGGPSGPSSNPGSGSNPSHSGNDLYPTPNHCKTWQYVLVDGTRLRECKTYDTTN